MTKSEDFGRIELAPDKMLILYLDGWAQRVTSPLTGAMTFQACVLLTVLSNTHGVTGKHRAHIQNV